MHKRDDVTKGMSHWESGDDEKLSNYTIWQSQLMAPYLGKRVLEIGPGTGRFTALLTSKHSFERFVALEPSSVLLDQFKKRGLQVETLNSTVEELGEEYTGAFDTIILIHVLEHIEKDDDFLKKAGRLLRPGGQWIIMVPALQFLMSNLDRNIGHYRRYNKKMIQKLARDLDYEIVANRYDNFIGIFGWFWFCKVRKIHYQEKQKKKTLMGAFSFFDKVVLPVFSRIEKIIPPPLGLNLTAILRKTGE